MKIELSLTSLTPYHSAPVSGGDFVVTNEGFIKKKSPGVVGSPLTRTYTQPFYLASSGEQINLPLLRSNQVVKLLRNKLNNHTFESLSARELRISSISTYAGMSVGAASGKPTGMNPTLDQISKASNTPIALFGGGSYQLSSLLQVGDAVLLHASLIDNNLVSVPAHKSSADIVDADPHMLTFPVPITRNDPVSDIRGSSIQNIKVVDEYSKQVSEWQESVSASQKKRKTSKESEGETDKKSDLNNLVAVEAATPGMTYICEINLPKHAGLAAIGATINTILELIEDGAAIGGRISRGMGRFIVGASIDGVKLDAAGKGFEDELAAYSEWLDQVTPNELSEFFEK